MPSFFQNWIKNPNRVPLLRWIAGFFTAGTIIILIAALRYFGAYRIPRQPLGLCYTLAAFTSHFSSSILLCALAVTLITLLLPVRRVTALLSIFLMTCILTLVLIDSQLYTAHRFHITLLTMRIMGFHTWGFALFYFILSLVFFAFLAKFTWERHVIKKKKLFLFISLPVIVLTTTFTHLAHIRADINGYVPIIRFTTTLPFFYPATDRHRQAEKGADITKRRLDAQKYTEQTEFHYPRKELTFARSEYPMNILLIVVDGMRFDLMNEMQAPNCMRFITQRGIRFTNHWSGGNSTRMGMFSLFYGMPSTYQPYIQTNRISPVLVDRLLEEKYRMGIFSSYRITIPAALDLTAFSRVPDLRCETDIPGPPDPWRKDSAITDEWKVWISNHDTTRPFFGFLFYDAVLHQNIPPSWEERVAVPQAASEQQRKHSRYNTSMIYVDSLVGSVLADMASRNLLDNTVIIVTSDHGFEFDDNRLGFTGHGSAYSEYQLRVPLLLAWPGKDTGTVIDKRTSHSDLCPTLMQELLGCTSPAEVYSSGFNLFSDDEWSWLVAASYFNNAIIEPGQVTVQYPTGHFEVRDRHYNPIAVKSFSPAMKDAFAEMSRFFSR